MKKIILLDVDGVIGPVGATTLDTRTVSLGVWYVVEIPQYAEDFLIWLEGKAEVIWLSTFKEHSNKIAKALNLPDKKHLDFSIPPVNSGSDKIPTIIKFCNENSDAEILFIDDEIGEITEDAIKELSEVKNLTLMGVNPFKGLTPDHVERAKNWVNS